MNQGKELIANVWTAALSNGGREAEVSGWVAAAGVTISAALGGWDKALQVLLILMAADYVTGLLGAVKLHKVNSDVMFWGGIRKVTVLFVVGLASLLDDWIQPGAPIFRTAAIYFYVGREGLSVVENLGTMGTPLPPWLKRILQQLGEKGEDVSK